MVKKKKTGPAVELKGTLGGRRRFILIQREDRSRKMRNFTRKEWIRGENEEM